MYDIDGDNKISKEEVLEAQYIYEDSENKVIHTKYSKL